MSVVSSPNPEGVERSSARGACRTNRSCGWRSKPPIAQGRPFWPVTPFSPRCRTPALTSPPTPTAKPRRSSSPQLHRHFGGDALCAEEQTDALIGVPSTGARLWVVDPIDGTRGFAQKNGEFSVMIGFVEDGVVAVGVVLEPAAGRLTYAVRGGGCWRQDGDESVPSPCTVSDVTTMAAATLTQSRSRPGQTTQAVRDLRPAKVYETHSAGVKLARVARGEADVYVNFYAEFHDWDICAGHLLVEEAGGAVTGLAEQELVYGTPGAWQRHGLLATNGHLHGEALFMLGGSNGAAGTSRN